MAKSRNNMVIDTIDECFTNGVKNGIFQVSLGNVTFNGRTVIIEGKELVSFGSCSYLGLEVDERLKQGAIEATQRFGTQYSSSRAYSSCNLYEELEHLFYRIFDNNPAIVAATTTLTHISAIPILVHADDLVILDHQVHGSVQLAVQLAKAKGTRVEMIRHNRMDMLEDLLKEHANKYNKVWYMADGIYSMFGDFAPLKDIVYLMEKYGNFHLYIDDAHGLGWAGRHGNGYVLSQIPMHPKMVLTTSLAKGFGTGGGVLVVADQEMKRKILTCGSSYTFSGPIQPPMLGACVASAKILLSDEIYLLQHDLRTKIELTQNIIKQYDLPIVLPSNSPIFYIALGLPRTGYNMVKRLMKEGFYTNIGIFPGVPVNCTGLRLSVTNGQTNEDIKNVLDAFQHHFPFVMEEEGISIDKLSRGFKMPFEETKRRYNTIPKLIVGNGLTIQHERSIHYIDKALWDELLGDNGTFDWEGCRFLEETFCDNPEPENNWNFHYLIIRDETQKPILATFFTELLCKDDMVAPASVSQQIEEIRKKDKYYLTSKVVMMGSLLSEGQHLFVDRTSRGWKDALREMIRLMNEVQVTCGAGMVQLRDFDSTDAEMSDFLIKEGFIKVAMPDTHVLFDTDWTDENEYMQRLSTGNRWHFRRKVLDNKHFFDVRILSGKEKSEKGDVKTWHNLYANVKNKSYNINTDELPLKYFTKMMEHPNWEIIELRIKDVKSDSSDEAPIVSVGFCYKSARNNYSIMTIGLDYTYVLSHGCYRQALYQSVARANQLKCKKFYLGMDASIEKQRFGVKIMPKSVYIQANDNFNMELIGAVHTKQTL